MSNQINGGRGKYSAISSVDFYRRVPKDLTEVRALEMGFAFSGEFRRSSFVQNLHVLLRISTVQ